MKQTKKRVEANGGHGLYEVNICVRHTAVLKNYDGGQVFRDLS